MYLLFCWKVYMHSGDPTALDAAGRAGRFRQFVIGVPARLHRQIPQPFPRPPEPPPASLRTAA